MRCATRLAAVLSCMIAATSLSSPAEAGSLMTATFTGTVYDAYDDSTAAYFGMPGTALVGLPFVGIFVFDTTPQIGQDRETNPTDAYITGSGSASPVLRASLTINGQTLSYASLGYSLVGIGLGNIAMDSMISAWDEGGLHYQLDYALRVIAGGYIPGNLDTPYASVPGDAVGDGVFRLERWNDSQSLYETLYLFFDVTAVEVVPEPAGVIVLATGLVGLAARRRRRAAA